MANYQAQLLEVEAEIAEDRATRAEIAAMLDSMRSELAELQESTKVDVAKLPAGEVRDAVTLSTRAQVEGPALARSIRELEKRLEHSGLQQSRLWRKREDILAAIASEQASKMLASSKELVKVLGLFDEALSLFPPSGMNRGWLKETLLGTRRTLQELLDKAKASAAAGQ